MNIPDPQHGQYHSFLPERLTTYSYLKNYCNLAANCNWKKFFAESFYLNVILINPFIVSSVSDPYSFFTDPDPVDPDGGQYGSGSNPDPGL
jgi:hypothetical protein